MSGRVVCAGGAVQDLTFRLHAAPVPGTSNPSALASSFGGVARNVAVDLVVLGCDVRLVTAVGADDAGGALVRDLESRGVGTQHVRATADAVTAQYAAVIDPDGELVIGLAAMDALGLIEPGWLDDAWTAAWPDARGPFAPPVPGAGAAIEGTDENSAGGWAFCDANLSADVLAHAVQQARATGVRLVIDAVSTPKVVRLPRRLDGVTLLSCNADEAQTWLRHNGIELSDAPAPAALAEALVQAGAHAILVTFGAGGVVAAEREPDGTITIHQLPAEPVPVVNVTGAGDAMIAGAMHALIGGAPLPDAARAGQRLAARVVQSTGSTLP